MFQEKRQLFVKTLIIIDAKIFLTLRNPKLTSALRQSHDNQIYLIAREEHDGAKNRLRGFDSVIKHSLGTFPH